MSNPWWLFPEIMTHKTGWFRKHGVFWLQNVNTKLYESKKFCVFQWAFLTFCLQSKTTTLMRFSWEMFWFYLTILMFVHSFVTLSLGLHHNMNEWKRLATGWKYESFCQVIWNEWSDFVWLLWCARICFIGCRQPTSFHLNLTATNKITKLSLSTLLCRILCNRLHRPKVSMWCTLHIKAVTSQNGIVHCIY